MEHEVVSPLDPWPDQVAWRPLSPNYVGLCLLETILRLGGLAVSVLIAWWILDWWQLAALAGGIVFYTMVRVPFIVRQVRSWGYAERGEDLLVRHGLVVRKLSIVPYARMQFVDVSIGPLERLFGLATVRMHTAAVGVDAAVPGLAPDEAIRLRDRLAALGRSQTEGL